MILKSDRIAELLANPTNSPDPLVITPQPDLDELRASGAASIDLRLGTWFLSLRRDRSALLKVTGTGDDDPGENKLAKKHYVPFGGVFVLHPGCFVLGVTLEWMRLPKDLAGYVVGKSSWGRRGLVIATAVGIHPGFSACLTLEITNLGQMPIEIVPGMQICQLFLHGVETDSDAKARSSFVGKRRPTLGSIRQDDIAAKLAQNKSF